MQAEGMANVLQLDGGILGYFERVGGLGYEGRCFVFDGRVALDPQLRPLQDGVLHDGTPDDGALEPGTSEKDVPQERMQAA